jgi:transcriptional regulator with XRE-family HTH domain
MNFGEKLKQIRIDKGLTQPQFAEAIGIEQSYLSKLENDKSVPSAEMFATIVSGLGMDPAAFLKDIDSDVLTTTLKHIPAVSQFNHHAAAVQVHDYKKWLYGSALAWVLGFALMLAANDGIFFSNKLYKYTSPGVILASEAENVFEKYDDILKLKRQANIITVEEYARQKTEFEANRARPVTVEWPASRGTVYYEPADGGRRRFDLAKTEYIQAPGNRLLQFLGAIVMVCGFVGLFIDWRLRRLKNAKRR